MQKPFLFLKNSMSLACLILSVFGGIPTVALAQSGSPYGQRVMSHWRLGSRLEDKGDFNSAQIEYQRALEASRSLTDSVLRDCAISGSQARIESAKAARAYLRANGNSRQSLQQAQQIARTAFSNAWNDIDQRRPDLVNSCP